MLDSAGMTSSMQRAVGRASVRFCRQDAVTRLADQHQSGSAKVMLPRVYGTPTEAVFLNTAGGLTGGDRFTYAAHADVGADIVATTQTAERLYRSASGPAVMTIALTAGAGARLHWLPQETIVFDDAALTRNLTAKIDADADLLLAESYVLGRTASGEVVRQTRLSDQWQVFRGGRLVHMEALRLDGDRVNWGDGIATLSGARAFGTLLCLGPVAEALLPVLRNRIGQLGPAVEAAASTWNGKLVIRLLARDGRTLRLAMGQVICAARDMPLPRVWQLDDEAF